MADTLKWSECAETLKLFEEIGKARLEFYDIPKNKSGQKGNQKFKYAPYGVIFNCIKEGLAKHGISIIQPMHQLEDGTDCVTLIVSGHGGMITATHSFEGNKDPQEFGKVSTYHRRYALQSFFCLEGDKDADDPPDYEPPTTSDRRTAPVAKEESKAPQPNTSEDGSKAESKEITVEKKEVSKAKVEDTRSVAQRLNDAMKQLKWGLSDFNNFMQEHKEHFENPNKSVTKIPSTEKEKLYWLLVEHKGVAPFEVGTEGM